MNERIKELLAKLDIDLYTDKGVMMTKILVRPKDLRQFAELIVKECIQAIQNESKDPMDELEYGLRVAEGAILDHFGVKE